MNLNNAPDGRGGPGGLQGPQTGPQCACTGWGAAGPGPSLPGRRGLELHVPGPGESRLVAAPDGMSHGNLAMGRTAAVRRLLDMEV